MTSGSLSSCPAQIAGYEIQGLIGRGGMGEVYLARQLNLGRPVAIKFLTTDGLISSEVRAARFRREAELMAQVSHPNILSIYDYGTIDGRSYLVMEYVEGGDLRRLMRPGRPMPLIQVRATLTAVAEALDCLHRNGILHRDLKPENILMLHGDDPKVADFGLAVLRTGTGSLTRSQDGLGTIGYVSPEQRYRLRVDERADQYSLASLAYELLTGDCPLGIIRPPSTLNDRLNPAVDAILLRALQEDPDDRFATIREFIGELMAAIEPGDPRVHPRRERLPWAIAGIAMIGLVATWASLLLTGMIGSSSGRSTPSDRPGSEQGRIDPPPSAASGPTSPEAPPTRTNARGMAMVRLPAGTFWMGSPANDPSASDDERPRRLVRIARPFWIGAHEVTVAQFRTFVEQTGYVTVAEREGGRVWDRAEATVRSDPAFTWRDPGYDSPPGDHEPVVQIARPDAGAFCRWLSDRDANTYRLPTEAEWEYACRAGTTTVWSFGDDPADLASHGWSRAESSWKLHPVGQKRPNPWGLYDIHGNAWELCSDWYDAYPEPEPAGDAVVDPTGPEKGYRWVLRGGSWDSLESVSQTRSAARSHKTFPYFTVGFRVCHDEPTDPIATALDESSRDARP